MLETGICGVQIGCTCIESDKIGPAERAHSKSEPRAALQHVESSAIEFRLIETVLGELGAGDPSGMPMTTKLPTGSIVGRAKSLEYDLMDLRLIACLVSRFSCSTGSSGSEYDSCSHGFT
jgi:hypothetical protein